MDGLYSSWPVIITFVVILSTFIILIVFFGIKAQYNKQKTGIEALIGMKGIAMETLSPKGRVRVNGEFWDSIAEEGIIAVNTEIEVTKIKDFKLTVKSLPFLTK